MRVLIVEGDMAVAGEIGPSVAAAGHELVGLAADRDTAVALLQSTAIDLAMIDLRLLDGWTGLDVSCAAKKCGVAFVFTTADRASLPDDLSGACALIEKPYRPKDVEAALRFLGRHLADGASGLPPRRLVLPVEPESTPRAAPRERASSTI